MLGINEQDGFFYSEITLVNGQRPRLQITQHECILPNGARLSDPITFLPPSAKSSTCDHQTWPIAG